MEIHGVELGVAFVAGIVSFLSPCVLPLVPAYVSYVAGVTVDDLARQDGQRPAILAASLMFVLGFSTVFVLFGASATAAGAFVLRHSVLLVDIAAIVVILFGLVMMGVLRLPFLGRDFRFHPSLGRGRAGGAYVLGLAFGFGWTPCIGPVLGSILAIAATKATIAGGIALLAVYALGLGLPFLGAAFFTGVFLRHLGGLGRFGHRLQIVAGAALVAMGIAMLAGWVSAMAWWLLEAFPFLAGIG